MTDKPIGRQMCEFCEDRTDTWHGITGYTYHHFFSCTKVETPEGYRSKMEATEACSLLDQAVCPEASRDVNLTEYKG